MEGFTLAGRQHGAASWAQACICQRCPDVQNSGCAGWESWKRLQRWAEVVHLGVTACAPTQMCRAAAVGYIKLLTSCSPSPNIAHSILGASSSMAKDCSLLHKCRAFSTERPELIDTLLIFGQIKGSDPERRKQRFNKIYRRYESDRRKYRNNRSRREKPSQCSHILGKIIQSFWGRESQ